MSTAPSLGARSTAAARRRTVLAHAISVFAGTGYYATPVAEVAAAAGISTAYVFRLFPGKTALFVAALEHCFDQVLDALAEGADATGAEEPEAVLSAMGDAYARLIADRSLLMLQVHALSATDVPEIRAALQQGLGRVVGLVRLRSGGSEHAVQQFVATGQLCHLIVAAGLLDRAPDWARTVTAGMAHPDSAVPAAA